MAKIRMRDTTAHADYGSMLAGEVYEVADEHATHLALSGLAAKVGESTKTYHERERERAQESRETTRDDGPPLNPDIARQIEQAGTRAGDIATRGPVSTTPVNDETIRQSAEPITAENRVEYERELAIHEGLVDPNAPEGETDPHDAPHRRITRGGR